MTADLRWQARVGAIVALALMVLAAGLGGVGSGGAASAATVDQQLDCDKHPDRVVRVSGTAPGTIVAGGTLAVEVTVPESQAGQFGQEDTAWAVALPTGATLVSGSVTTSGPARIAPQGSQPYDAPATAGPISGGVRLAVPQRVAVNTLITPPKLRFRLRATGAPGTDISIRMHPTVAHTYFTVDDVTCATIGARPALSTTRVVPGPDPSSSSTAPANTAPTTSTTTTQPPTTSTETWALTAAECGSATGGVVPENATSAQATVVGAAGGAGTRVGGGAGAPGGAGARVTATFPVTPGTTLSAMVGCSATAGSFAAGNGYGGPGGEGYNVISGSQDNRGGTGGGASAICRVGACDPLANDGVTDIPVVVAGGGGGGGATRCSGTALGTGGAAGTGSVTTGGGGSGASGGAGTTVGTGTGGAGGVSSVNGDLNGGFGGSGSSGGINAAGGGGGGGYRGGAGGAASEAARFDDCVAGGGGGAGSSWVQTNATGVTHAAASTAASVTIVFTIVTPAPNPVDVTPFASAADLVDQQYVDLLDRVPTTSELNSAVAAIQGRTKTPEDLVVGLLSTDSRAPDAQIIRLYLAYFKRPPETTGLDYWLAQLAGGKSIHTASNQFVNTPEFRSLYGTLTNRQFVDRVYLNVLGRPGEADGVAYWTAELDAGRLKRGTLMTQFSEAVENRTAKAATVGVVRLYREMLGNTPRRAYLDAAIAHSTDAQAVWRFVVDDIRHSAGYARKVDLAR